MSISSGGTAESLRLQHRIEAEFGSDVVYINHDEKYVYAACTDLKVRVWSKDEWQLIATLGDTTSPPLAVHIDDEHVYATCEKRVYVWTKNTWGMIGWFELTYTAVTSTLRGEYLYVGAKEGRLVSIKKDTHDTSSWQLFKSDITRIWADGEIICTSTNKDESVVWKIEKNTAPSEIARLDKKDKGAHITGNNAYILSGLNTSEIKMWDRVDWSRIRTLQPAGNNGLVSLWSNSIYLISASNTSSISIWDLRKGTTIGTFKVNGFKILQVRADSKYVFLATTAGIKVLSLSIGGQQLDLNADENSLYGTQVLRTSPYDVLEVVLELQKKGDQFLDEGEYHEAVSEFEHALQLLIDNNQALLEVPKEREKITTEINDRLGQSLLRAKIVEMQEIVDEIESITDELDREGRTSRDEESLDKVWTMASRAIKESRVLAEAQGGHILSYQLSHESDILDSSLSKAKEKVEKYKEKITYALTLTQNIRSEWRWLERKRTSLEDRLAFLESAVRKLETRIKESSADDEVRNILVTALNEYTQLRDQISRILDASTNDSKDVLLSKDEAIAAIEGLLNVLPKRRKSIEKISDDAERHREMNQLIEALQQAVEAAEQHKLKDEALKINAEMATILLKDEAEEPSITSETPRLETESEPPKEEPQTSKEEPVLPKVEKDEQSEEKPAKVPKKKESSAKTPKQPSKKKTKRKRSTTKKSPRKKSN
ncbi:MAG: hypothetical protein ACFFEF_04630 [Candidatus Thorarchaeota archaeon]